MRLGFDLDEVVVNLTSEFEKYLASVYGIDWPVDCFVNYNMTECSFHNDSEFNDRISKDMVRVANDPEFQYQAEPYKDAREVLHKLKHSGHKIYFITSRPKRNQPYTFKWLRRNDIPFDNLTVIGHDEPKGVYSMKYRLDMYVDDQEQHLESMLSYKKRWRKGLLLIDKPWNYNSIDGSKFIRVYEWKDILRHVGIQNR